MQRPAFQLKATGRALSFASVTDLSQYPANRPLPPVVDVPHNSTGTSRFGRNRANECESISQLATPDVLGEAAWVIRNLSTIDRCKAVLPSCGDLGGSCRHIWLVRRTLA